jgi:hypothetical protein
MIQAKPSDSLTCLQTMSGLQVSCHTFHASPKFGKVNVDRLTRHAKTNCQVRRLTLRQRFKALREC